MNSTFNTSFDCKNARNIIQIYILPVICMFGIIFNGFCVVTFWSMVIKNSKLKFIFCFKCYLFKAINDFSMFILQIFGPIYYCEQCGLSNTLFPNIWFIYFFSFMETLLVFNSVLLDILALLNFFVILINKSIWFLSIKSIYLFFGLSVFTCLFSSLMIVRFKIISYYSLETNRTIYKIDITDYYKSEVDKYLRFMTIFFRDILTFFLIIMFNILIIYQMKKAAKRKKILTHHETTNKNQSSNNNLAKKAAGKTFLILVYTSIIYLIGHFPLIIYYLPIDKQQTSKLFWDCYYDFSLIPYFISFLFPILINIIFNKHFRNCFKLIFLRLCVAD